MTGQAQNWDSSLGSPANAGSTTMLGHFVRTARKTYGVIKYNLTATVAPTSAADSASDYSVGSLWVDVTADRVYMCVDATAGAAVWDELSLPANAIVDSDFAGTYAGILTRTGSAAYAAKKWNLSAAAAPTANDDNTADYGIGSFWLDTTADRAYICLDASTGAAVWREISVIGASVNAAGGLIDQSFGGSFVGRLTRTGAAPYTYAVIRDNLAGAAAPTVNDDSGANYGVGSFWWDTTNDLAYTCLDASAGAAVWRLTTFLTLTLAYLAAQADDSTTPGFVVLVSTALADATGNEDIVLALPAATTWKVCEAWVEQANIGDPTNNYTLGKGASAISAAIAGSATDGAFLRIGSIAAANKANNSFANGDTLRWAVSKTAANAGGTGYALLRRTA